MKKILFGITSLGLGGAERVLVDVANKLSNIYDITIFTIYSNGELEKQLNKNIKLEHLMEVKYEELSNAQKIIKPLQIMLFKKEIYKKYIKGKYDVEISFLEGPVTRIISTQNADTKKIAWIHNDIRLVFGNGIKSKIKRKIDKKTYECFDKLVFVSKDNEEKFEEVYNIDVPKEVIYNYIDINSVIEKANEYVNTEFNNNEVNIVTVSRLVKQKALDRLINVHARLLEEGIKHKIYVIGDGPEKENLNKLIKDKHVEKTFILIGKKENPYPYIKNATCFALLSNFEGYPMVLLEAQILEKFIIITNTAAREAIRNYSKSMIVGNDEDSIYMGLYKYIKMQEDFDAENNETEKYNNENILIQIQELIEEEK